MQEPALMTQEGEDDAPLSTSSLDASVYAHDPREAVRAFERDILIITGRKTDARHSSEMNNHKRRLVKNYERERALRSQAMTAVRELNRSEVAAAASLRIAKEGTNTITERRKAAIQHAKKANKFYHIERPIAKRELILGAQIGLSLRVTMPLDWRTPRPLGVVEGITRAGLYSRRKRKWSVIPEEAPLASLNRLPLRCMG